MTTACAGLTVSGDSKQRGAMQSPQRLMAAACPSSPRTTLGSAGSNFQLRSLIPLGPIMAMLTASALQHCQQVRNISSDAVGLARLGNKPDHRILQQAAL